MKKKTHSKEFKAKLALEALRGEKTIQELAQIHNVHPNMITRWKKQLLESASDIFANKKKAEKEKEDSDKKLENLYNQIGILQVEKEFLKKKYKQIFGTEPDL